MHWSKFKLSVGAAVLAAAGLCIWAAWPRDARPGFRTAPVKRGDLAATISATGTLEPQAAVDVGAQVQGDHRRLRQGRRART